MYPENIIQNIKSASTNSCKACCKHEEHETLCDFDKNGVVRPHKESKAVAKKVGWVFRKHGYEKVADKINDCGDFMHFKVYEQGKKLKRANLCKHRMCPRCQRFKSIKLKAQLNDCIEAMHEAGEEFAAILLTLTVPNVTGDNLGEELRRISKGCTQLKKYKPFDEACLGYIRSLEVTVNEEDGTYHPHAHMLILVPKYYFSKQNGLYVTHEKLGDLWMRSLGIKNYEKPYHVSLQAVKDNGKGLAGMVAEVAKYCVKPLGLYAISHKEDGKYKVDVNEEALLTITDALHKKRLISFGGLFKEYRDKLHQKDVEEMEEQELLGENDDAELGKYLGEGVFRWDDSIGDYVLYKFTPEEEEFERHCIEFFDTS